MNCTICERKRINADRTAGGMDCPGVCDQCVADANLGKLVRNMPRDSELRRIGDTWIFADRCGHATIHDEGATPEEAIKKAMGLA